MLNALQTNKKFKTSPQILKTIHILRIVNYLLKIITRTCIKLKHKIKKVNIYQNNWNKLTLQNKNLGVLIIYMK